MSSANTPTAGPLDPAVFMPLPLQPGDIVAGRYEVLRLVGSGGFAFVYAVRDRKIGDEIALKLLRHERRSGIDVERTRREAEFARGSDSHWLVRTFDLCEADGMVFLTMELVPGGSLRDLLRRGPLPVDEVVRLGCEILHALHDLHRLEVVHRDLKPANLLITAGGHVKLSDFGIARRIDDDSHLTMTGLPVGTAAYLSPEQARAENVDHRSDLYSFGAVLFEMLTGRVPFEAPAPVATVALRKLRPDTPRWLAAVVARLLEPRREDRYESAAAALVDFRRRHARASWPATLVAVFALLFIAAGVAAWRWEARFNDVQLVKDGDWGLRAVDGDGNTLWTLPNSIPSHAVVVHRGRKREVAAILTPKDTTTDPALTHALSFFDLRTGRLLRQRRLPSAASEFSEVADRFGVDRVTRTDLNGDGYDEVEVTYSHDYFPSYTVLHDLHRDEARVIFIASGHHRIEQSEDVDGDGLADLIFSGISNRMGWLTGVAAIRVSLDGHPDDVVYTPDRTDHTPSGALIWYALAPPGMLRPENVIVDRNRRMFLLEYRTRPPYAIDFDGFPPGARSTLMARNTLRGRVYDGLRDVSRLLANGDAARALAAAQTARSIAIRIDDPWLCEWSRRNEGSAMVAGGHAAEADGFFRDLSTGEAAGDVAWDAGKAFHLAGDLPRAVRWYRKSLESAPFVGRMKYEPLEGLLFALGEMGRWDEALQGIDAFAALVPNEQSAPFYRQYVGWRRGERPKAAGGLDEANDLFRAWALEEMLARGADPRNVLTLIDRECLRAPRATRSLLLLARAEALRRAGNSAQALQMARDAYELLRVERRTDPAARGHFDLALQRLAQLGWHPNGISR